MKPIKNTYGILRVSDICKKNVKNDYGIKGRNKTVKRKLKYMIN
jgi:hypothetical protein